MTMMVIMMNNAEAVPGKNLFATLDIRENVLKNIGKEVHLLEPFAGDGQIYNKCYKGRVESAVGIEKSEITPDCGRKIYRGNYSKLLRTMDVSKFNVFDIDSYHSPWYPFWTICNRLNRSEFDKIGFVLIENQNDKMFDKMEKGMKKVVGINNEIEVPKLSRHRWYLRELIITKGLEKAGYKWLMGWRSANLTKKCDYMSFIIERSKDIICK